MRFLAIKRVGLVGMTTVTLTTLVIVGRTWGQRPPAEGNDKDRPAVPSTSRTAEALPAFDRALRDLYDRVAPSTVNLFAEPKHEHMGSGVVIDAKGHILTHAHHGLTPGTPFSAVFPDGKKVPGKLLGVHEPFDLSLIKIDAEGGPWPWANHRNSSREPCAWHSVTRSSTTRKASRRYFGWGGCWAPATIIF